MTRNEKTSPGLASLAGRLVAMDEGDFIAYVLSHPAEVRSAMASLLTQAADSEPEPPPDPEQP